MNTTQTMTYIPSMHEETFADFVNQQQAKNDIQLNIRKYCLMLCDVCLNIERQHPNQVITNSTLNLVVSITN